MTHTEYMSNSIQNHHTYFLQFAEAMDHQCRQWWTRSGYLDKDGNQLPFTAKDGQFYQGVENALKDDRNLNNLKRDWLDSMDKWTLAHAGEIKHLKKRIDGRLTWSLSDGTCTLKAWIREHIKQTRGDYPYGGEE